MILYIETNYILGAATGRDAHADDVLHLPAAGLRVCLPCVCVMEACSWFEDERKRRRSFDQDHLKVQIGELKRDLTSSHAKSLLSHLEQARLDNLNLLNDIDLRLRRILLNLAGIVNTAEVIPLRLTWDTDIVSPIVHQPTDNLILSVIHDHALENAAEEKVLLSSNSKDFGNPTVRALLAQWGIHEYFSRTEAFLGWFNSRVPPDSSV